ncbi:arsenate reductase ArsC [Thalassotalea agarivorans]|uniref:Arsenate reductase n=1 Tax=Thalassotalea agarivorans TaxID=349064 RepID=A0A1I0H356_THASX|nr:arsenate reductase ArsC [Thalassotalea agarivorans]SET77982.1 arsenate reductase [Thalassotalea agarivorans]
MKILYICTHNRCRSILSEAVTNHIAGSRIVAKSAGSQPAGEVHPLSLKYLDKAGFPIDGLQSQSWDDFEDFAPDLVVTLCDSAAGEACPVWFGNAIKLHWGLEDPSKLEGSEEALEQAFNNTIEQISERVRALMSLTSEQMEVENLAQAIASLDIK